MINEEKHTLYRILPKHYTALGSGSHFPFSMHVDVIDTMSTQSELQCNVIFEPSDIGAP